MNWMNIRPSRSFKLMMNGWTLKRWIFGRKMNWWIHVGEQKDERMNSCRWKKDEWMNGWIHVGEQKDEWMNGWTHVGFWNDEWMNFRHEFWMNWWTFVQHVVSNDERMNIFWMNVFLSKTPIWTAKKSDQLYRTIIM